MFSIVYYSMNWVLIIIWFEMVRNSKNVYSEKVVARYDPHSNPEGGGGHHPNGTLKSWQLQQRVSFVKISASFSE